jgi:hypothetical protein
MMRGYSDLLITALMGINLRRLLVGLHCDSET